MHRDEQFWQQFPRWRYVQLGHSQVATIGSAGCLLSCVTRMLAQEDADHADVYTPPRVNRWLRNHGGFLAGSGNLVFAAVDGLGVVRFHDRFDWIGAPSPDPVESVLWLARQHDIDGRRVILQVDSSFAPGFQQHWVLLERILHDDRFGRQGLVFLAYDPTHGYSGVDVGTCFARPGASDLGTAIWGGAIYEVVND